MIIDFHAHIYPEKIAVKAGQSISKFYDDAPVRLRGTAEDLLENGSKAGVTKNTDLLIVPYTGYSSTKMNKIGPDTKIVAIDEFVRNMDYYLTMIK